MITLFENNSSGQLLEEKKIKCLTNFVHEQMHVVIMMCSLVFTYVSVVFVFVYVFVFVFLSFLCIFICICICVVYVFSFCICICIKLEGGGGAKAIHFFFSCTLRIQCNISIKNIPNVFVSFCCYTLLRRVIGNDSKNKLAKLRRHAS